MRITLGNIDGKAYGLNASEACVYAAIDKCSRGDNAKGWYGTMASLAEVLPFKVSRQSCMRSVDKLLNLGLIYEEGQKLFANVQNGQNDVQNGHDNVQNGHDNVQNELPPNNPPIYNIKNMNKESKQQPRADMRTRDGAQQPAAGSLIESFNALKRAWLTAGGVTSEFERRGASVWKAWIESSEPKRRAILKDLSYANMTKSRPAHWNNNPLFYVTDFPEPEPTDWNGVRSIEPPEPVQIACYNGHWGMYTPTDIELYHLKTKEQ